jgi:hypothetical protein
MAVIKAANPALNNRRLSGWRGGVWRNAPGKICAKLDGNLTAFG